MSTVSLESLEKNLGLDGLARALEEVLARSADPAPAPALAHALLEAAARENAAALVQIWHGRRGPLLEILGALCGASPFLATWLSAHPGRLFDLAGEDFSKLREAAEYEGLLRGALKDVPEEDIPGALRRFKYYELARITVRDLSARWVPEPKAGEILAELSHLADVLLEAALSYAGRRLAAELGEPSWRGPGGERLAPGFCVLALGKLGAEELNYSSDVDLVYVQGDLPAALSGGPRDLSPEEYFTRLAGLLGKTLSESSGEGFLYRVDLDLRPQGAGGPLIVTESGLSSYYESWAATWEKAAFMKARPVAGDLRLGWRVLRAIDPMIYRGSMDFAGVAAIREMKEKVEQARGGAEDDIKTGPGGIRDIETIAQALQLLHGGRIPQVRGRSTQQALVSLAQVHVLPQDQVDALLAAYRFLRRVENRLQMEAEKQTQRLPHEDAGWARLARSLGFLGEGAVREFRGCLQAHRGLVRESFSQVLGDSDGGQILDLFARNVPRLFATAESRLMVENLARDLARELARSADPARALNNLDRFIQGVGPRMFYYGLLLDRPELVGRLVTLFAASDYLSGYFARHPKLIEPIFADPKVLLLPPGELRRSREAIRRATPGAPGGDAEAELDALRIFRNREVLNVGLLDLVEKVTLEEAEASLTDVAEVCIEGALALAKRQIERQAKAAGAWEFLVVGMGKLASRELSYGSDLDVVFFFSSGGGEEELVAQEYCVRLAQKLIWALSTRTGEGTCYEMDTRLRPSGRQGMLVSSLESFVQYHERSAQVWERQALLRARAVAGNPALSKRFEETRGKILSRPAPKDLAGEVDRLRARMEKELARETSVRHDFKTGRGGLVDVESAVQYLQLLHGAAHAELLAAAPIAAVLEKLRALNLLSRADFETLREGWEFLRRLSSRLRILENRSISDLDEEQGDLDALARRLGYAGTEREGGARRALLESYRRHTAAIRGAYGHVVVGP